MLLKGFSRLLYQLVSLMHPTFPFFLKLWLWYISSCITCCPTSVSIENESDLNVLCKVCTAVKGRLFEFCWQCLREWKGARPRKDRCGNRGCCNQSLETLNKCPTITFGSVKECPSVRACPTCGLLLEHSKMYCKSVHCPRCNVTFCFVCLKSSSTCLITRFKVESQSLNKYETREHHDAFRLSLD
uniref:RBR-type E3 ubiquitin transferase n=1 Tax=Neolamprologus brichardi TaxID=32507 RepID=A0A3Q4IGC6_NEOBR